MLCQKDKSKYVRGYEIREIIYLYNHTNYINIEKPCQVKRDVSASLCIPEETVVHCYISGGREVGVQSCEQCIFNERFLTVKYTTVWEKNKHVHICCPSMLLPGIFL